MTWNPRGEQPRRDADAADGAGVDATSPVDATEPAPGDAPEPGPDVGALRAELDAARKRVDELARAVQAMTREKEDFKVRLQRERDRMLEVEKGNVAVTLIEALDDLDLCLSASSTDASPLAKGVRLIRSALLKRLLQLDVERLDLLGKPYDPNLAEAADMEVTPNAEDDQLVTFELRAGYQLHDRVIRPARVRVAKYVRPMQA